MARSRDALPNTGLDRIPAYRYRGLAVPAPLPHTAELPRRGHFSTAMSGEKRRILLQLMLHYYAKPPPVASDGAAAPFVLSHGDNFLPSRCGHQPLVHSVAHDRRI